MGLRGTDSAEAMTRCRTTLKGRTTKSEGPDESGLMNQATTKIWGFEFEISHLEM